MLRCLQLVLSHSLAAVSHSNGVRRMSSKCYTIRTIDGATGVNKEYEIPAIALGTYLGYGTDGPIKSKDNALQKAIENAIDLGYRHIDTAFIYENEEEIGNAIQAKIQDGSVKREDLFITTKLWNTHHKRNQVHEAIEGSLKRLQLNYVDLYLVHWPVALNSDNTFADVDIKETWSGMEDAVRNGSTRCIGLSNFNQQQIEYILQKCDIAPSALQIEVHPQMIQNDLNDFAKSKGMVVMGYSPFGSLVSRYGTEFPGPKTTTASLKNIAEKYNKTVTQIILAWQVNRNIIPVPKALQMTHLKNNIDIFDIKLTPEEMDVISSFDSGTRYTLPSFWQDHPNYPFQKIDQAVKDPFSQ